MSRAMTPFPCRVYPTKHSTLTLLLPGRPLDDGVLIVTNNEKKGKQVN